MVPAAPFGSYTKMLITKPCNSSFYHLHNIKCIRKHLSRDSLLVLIHAFITSRLDFCNDLLYGLPKSQSNYNVFRMQLGARSFCAAAPCLWNSLPAELRDIQSLCNFKRKLNTHLCRAG